MNDFQGYKKLIADLHGYSLPPGIPKPPTASNATGPHVVPLASSDPAPRSGPNFGNNPVMDDKTHLYRELMLELSEGPY